MLAPGRTADSPPVGSPTGGTAGKPPGGRLKSLSDMNVAALSVTVAIPVS